MLQVNFNVEYKSNEMTKTYKIFQTKHDVKTAIFREKNLFFFFLIDVNRVCIIFSLLEIDRYTKNIEWIDTGEEIRWSSVRLFSSFFDDFENYSGDMNIGHQA